MHNEITDVGLRWPKLIPGTLVKRYKRFLADVRLDNDKPVTAHCPNSGSMTACCETGRPVFLSFHDNPRRKLKYSWELIDMPDSLVGVNTMIPNRLVAHSIEKRLIPEFIEYNTVKREVSVGNKTRLDLMLTGSDAQPCYVEIKNCTLVENGLAMFPDAVTTRGKKHLVELQRLVKQKARCVIFFLIQRMDALKFSPAAHIDPDYAAELKIASQNGVDILCYDVHIDMESIRIRRKLPVIF